MIMYENGFLLSNLTFPFEICNVHFTQMMKTREYGLIIPNAVFLRASQFTETISRTEIE